MKRKICSKPVFFLFLSFFYGVVTSYSQDKDTVVVNMDTSGIKIDSSKISSPKNTKDTTVKKYLKNNVKMNISSLALNNYSIFYERSISKKISFQAGYRYMPATKLSEITLSKQVLKQLEAEGDDLKNELDKITASGNAITGEFRFYTGHKPGARGFYASLYGRYASFKVDYDYEYTSNSKPYMIPLKSDFHGIGAGLLLGMQFLIAKRIVLDVFMLGGHFGKLNGNASAMTDLSDMTDEEQAQLKSDLESLVVFGNSKLIKSAVVNDNGVKMTIQGPFAGIRMMGISLGFAF
jgi:hypothetical protein